MESRDSYLAVVLAKYDRLVDWERRDRGAMKVDSEPLRALLQQLNNPQKKFRTIHIAGTKGKGSVGALIEAGLYRAGLACGRFSSPHVERITNESHSAVKRSASRCSRELETPRFSVPLIQRSLFRRSAF